MSLVDVTSLLWNPRHRVATDWRDKLRIPYDGSGRAAIAACSTHTIISIEFGRLRLSPRLALKISRACAVDFS